ncbi:hypothetical protein [Sedimenticola sp.]|uniref:hemerythrin domain-containing protein n=1 Tax=Sedimenticola sp. TaxID=1940285 RepID=UPI003D10C024
MDMVTTDLHATPAISQGRHDLYLPVHKGIRAFMCEVLLNAGKVDSTDQQELESVLAQIRGLLYLCKAHLKHENNFLHNAMEAHKPGSSKKTAIAHEAHEREMQHIEQTILQVEFASQEMRAVLMTGLYRQVALFIAENFEHMHTEETENMPLLWEYYSDEELTKLEHELVAEIPADLNAVFLRWMLPYITPAERTNMLRSIKQQAPDATVHQIMEMLQQNLDARDWEKLIRELN